jgi:hypothetical protein
VKDRLLGYRTSFTARTLARVGSKDGTWGLDIEVGSDKNFVQDYN